MNRRKNIASGVKYEELVGYSRAVLIGNQVEVSGTSALSDGKVVGVGSPLEQTRFVLQKIAIALQSAGCSMSDVVRTRIFVTDIDQWENVGKAHREFFGNILPATTLVEVSRLFHPDLLVEIEANAIIDRPES